MTLAAALSITDRAADLEPVAVGAVGALAALLVVLAVGAQLSARRLARQLRTAEEELVDPATGLLPRSAVRVRLGAELAWAATSRTPISVAVLRVRGGGFTRAARVLRQSMRAEEQGFLLRDQRIAVELWGADAPAAAAGVARIGADLARAGFPAVDAGIATSPDDGTDVDTLIAVAGRDLRPVDDPPEDHGSRRPMGGVMRTQLGLLWAVLPWFVLVLGVLAAALRLLPQAIDASVAGALGGIDLLVALVAAIGLPLGAAFVHAAGWNSRAGSAPRARPIAAAGWRALLVVSLVVGVPLAWGVLAPDAPAELLDGFGATLAVLAIIVLALLQARQLVHVAVVPVALVGAAGAALTWLGVEFWSDPILANTGRMVFAAALGALLARCVDRPSWMVVLALGITAIDLWSVFADDGLTNQLLDGSSSAGGSQRIVDLLLLSGPDVGGAPLFELGTTDLVFIALFLAWAADWRLDMRLVTASLIAAAWAAVTAVELTAQVVPMLPFLAGAMLLTLAARGIRLWQQARRWRAD